MVLNQFGYMDHRGEWVVTDNFDQLVNTIYRFSFEERDLKESRQKEELEYKKYAAQACSQNLDSENIPTLFIVDKSNNLA